MDDETDVCDYPTATRDRSGKCRCLVCSRCGHHTGNSHQGHYWSYCKVTKKVERFHFCCPDDCELISPNEQSLEGLVSGIVSDRSGNHYFFAYGQVSWIKQGGELGTSFHSTSVLARNGGPWTQVSTLEELFDSSKQDKERAWDDYRVGDQVYDKEYRQGKLVRLYDFRGIPFAEVLRTTDTFPVDELNGRLGKPRPVESQTDEDPRDPPFESESEMPLSWKSGLR